MNKRRISKTFGAIVCFFRLAPSALEFKYSRTELDYWGWLFERVADRNSKYYNDLCAQKFLMIDALDREDFIGLVGAYELFGENLLNEGVTGKFLNSLKEAFESVGRTDLAQELSVEINKKRQG